MTRGAAMKNNKYARSLLGWCFFTIATIIAGIRVALTYELKGPLLVLYLIVTVIVAYSIVATAIKIYREHKQEQ